MIRREFEFPWRVQISRINTKNTIKDKSMERIRTTRNIFDYIYSTHCTLTLLMAMVSKSVVIHRNKEFS